MPATPYVESQPSTQDSGDVPERSSDPAIPENRQDDSPDQGESEDDTETNFQEKTTSDNPSKERHGGYNYILVYRPGWKYLTWLPVSTTYWEMEGFFKRSLEPELTFKVVKGSSVTYYKFFYDKGKVKVLRTSEADTSDTSSSDLDPSDSNSDFQGSTVIVDMGEPTSLPTRPVNPIFTPPAFVPSDGDNGSSDSGGDDDEYYYDSPSDIALLR